MLFLRAYAETLPSQGRPSDEEVIRVLQARNPSPAQERAMALQSRAIGCRRASQLMRRGYRGWHCGDVTFRAPAGPHKGAT